MNVLIVGGGPAGLFASILLKQADPTRDITLYERNRPDDTFGFGVVFSAKTLRHLELADPETYATIANAGVQWPDTEIRHRGEHVRCGEGFAAIGRQALLTLLQARARAVGVRLCFDTEVSDPSNFSAFDLIIAADGVNSRVREWYAPHFQPTVDHGQARYIWFGTTQRFSALTMIFEQNADGAFAAHAYPFDDETSTFIVETDEGSWRRAGLDRSSSAAVSPGGNDVESLAYCQHVFARHLVGQRLLANNSHWLTFRTLHNQRWHHGNIVLIGDAAHTAHFSIGSGTKLAMEDAIALAQALRAHSRDLSAAFDAYERERRPEVEFIQAAAEPSRAWWEQYRHYLTLDPRQFAFHFLTRSPQITYNTLARRDPQYIEQTRQWFASAEGEPVAQPLKVRGTMLPNRLAALDSQPSPDTALAPGFVVSRGGTDHVAPLDDGAIHGRWVSPAEDCLRLLPRLVADGCRLLMLNAPRAAQPPIVDTLERVRADWPAGNILSVALYADDWHDAPDDAVALAIQLKRAGCDLIGVQAGARDPGAGRKYHTLRHIILSDHIRRAADIATMTIGGIPGIDGCNTVILSGRADLCLL